MAEKPVFEVFLPHAQGLAHLFRFVCPGMKGAKSGEPMTAMVNANEDSVDLWFTRNSDRDAHVVFQNVKSAGVADVDFANETISKKEEIGSNQQEVDNVNGVADVTVKLRDLFSEEDTKDTSKSAGTSVSIEVTASEGVEGIADFEEKVSAEAHAEIEESEGHSVTREEEGEEETTVPKGKRVMVTETRARASGSIPVSANGKFSFGPIIIGRHYGGHWHTGTARFDSWQELKDVVLGQAPANAPFYRAFKQHPAYHADLWALEDIEAAVRYTVKFEGRIMRSYKVEEF